MPSPITRLQKFFTTGRLLLAGLALILQGLSFLDTPFAPGFSLLALLIVIILIANIFVLVEEDVQARNSMRKQDHQDLLNRVNDLRTRIGTGESNIRSLQSDTRVLQTKLTDLEKLQEIQFTKLSASSGESQAFIQTLLDSHLDYPLIINLEGQIIYTSQKVADFPGVHKAKLKEFARVTDVLPYEDFKQAVQRVLDGTEQQTNVFIGQNQATITRIAGYSYVLISMRRPDVDAFLYRNDPEPRATSTVGLGELLEWMGYEAQQPAYPGIHPVAEKCRTDPEYVGTHGLTGPAEYISARTIYQITRALKPTNVIEVGTHNAATSITIGQALMDNGSGSLHTVELNEGNYQLAQKNIAEADMQEIIHQYLGSSDDETILKQMPEAEFIFIDGDHSYEFARIDFENYAPFLKPGGIMLYHDTIKIKELTRLMNEIGEMPEYEIITLASDDGDGITLIYRLPDGE